MPASARWRGNACAFGLPVARERVQLRTARIGQSEQPRGLVVRFTGGVVAGAADDVHIGCGANVDELRVAARHEEREKRIGRFVVAIEKRREDVSVQVIDRVEWFVQREGERFGAGHADHETTDQPRSARNADRIDLRKRHAGAAEGIVDRRGK